MITPTMEGSEASQSVSPVNGFYVWAVALAGAMGGLLFGYDWVVIGGAKPFYERYFHLQDPWIQGWVISCALIGCLVGALVSGRCAERYGRRPVLMLAAAVFCVSSIGTALVGTVSSFILWRILGGVAIGLASNLSPMYIAEIAPAGQRGRLVALNQLTLVVGILLAQIVNWRIARAVPPQASALELFYSWNVQSGWRWMFGVTAIPSLVFLVATFLLPESPRWLSQKGQTARARRVLARVGGELYADSVLAQIDIQIDNQDIEKRSSGDWTALFAAHLRPRLLLGLALAVLQQWCGINIIFNYAEEVFAAAGYKVSDILFNIVVTGTVNLIFTLVALFTIDRFGRRPLMLFGSGGLVLIYVTLGWLYAVHSQGVHMLILVVTAIACYAVSLAPVTWVIISEIFPNQIRGTAMSACVTVLWMACFLLTFTFPVFNRWLGAAGTFWIYSGICALGFLYLLRGLPETKGKSLEQIEATWI